MERIIIKLDDDWHGNSTESLWAKPWFKEHTYQIRNIPFYTKVVSLDDIIEVEENEGAKYFKNVLKKSGHSTYRIFLQEKVTEDAFETAWIPLENMGCSYEKGYNRFYAIDVPLETDIYKAYSILQEGERNNIWEFEEGNIGHDLDE
jgi:hypothetical protein